jgi:hypothetical protein
MIMPAKKIDRLPIYDAIEVEPTTERVQDEPWYNDYTTMCEIIIAGDFERKRAGRTLALAACRQHAQLKHLSERKLLIWIRSAWIAD